MLMEEDNSQAEAKVNANVCVEICEEGLPLQQQAQAASGDRFSARRLLGANNAEKTPAPAPELKKEEPPTVAEPVPIEPLPPVKPFEYKGCQC